MTDPLAVFWIHDITVSRYVGPSVENGERYDDPVTVTGFYQDEQSNVRTQTGDMAEAKGVLAYPISEATIPLRSKLVLPDVFGSEEVEVVAVSIADGPAGTPRHKIAGVK